MDNTSNMSNSNTQFIVITITSLAALSIGIYYLMGGFPSKVENVNKDKNKEVKEFPSTKSKNRQKTSSNVDDASKYPAGDLVIYFGSQTGTAEAFARILMNEGKSKGFNAKTQDLEEFNPEILAKTKVAIFLMATYGEGEPTGA